MDTVKLDDYGNTLMIAHRGVSGLEKENTAAAFVAAGNRSYIGIETDVHRTADGRFVVIHDSKTERVAPANMRVEESSYEAIRAIRLYDIDGSLGRNDLRIPDLYEYVSICKKYGKTAVLELKNHFTEAEFEKIFGIIDGLGYFGKTIFITFFDTTILLLKKLRPDAEAQFLVSELGDGEMAFLKENGLDLDVYYKALTKERLDECHRAGIRVNVWTVNEKDEAEKLVGWGVDYITSNIIE